MGRTQSEVRGPETKAKHSLIPHFLFLIANSFRTAGAIFVP